MKKKITASVVIRIILWVILLLGGSVTSVLYDVSTHNPLFFSIWFHIATCIIGAVLMKFAFHAAAVGGKKLAKMGRSTELPRLETDTLVSSGIYAKMRHPMLFGLMLVPLALAFCLGSFTFILLVAPLEMLFIAFMVLVFEEKECKSKFGKDYDTYAKKVPMVCFKAECLKELFLR